ncbi:MAG: mechanosensitive ion channel family protein [Bacillota bacterium]
MQNQQLFEGIDILRTLSIAEFFLFFLYLFLILIGKWLAQAVLKRLAKHEGYQERVYPILEDVLNWIAFYGSILLFLFYFWQEEWLKTPFYETEGVGVSILLIVVAIMIVTFSSRVIKAFNNFVMPHIYGQFDVETGMSYTINRLIYYVVMFLALAVSFTLVGLDLRAVGVIFSVLGIGIGFGVRNIAANFVSGIIILFERPMEVGEMVEIDKKIGRITKIKLRSTIVETSKDGTLVVPNQYFIEQIVKNRSGARLFARVVVSVEYGFDTELVESIMIQAAEREVATMEGVPAEKPDAQFIDFRNSSMDFQVEARVTNVEMKDRLESRIRHSIAALFVENDIRLASLPGERSE